jgi:hypothetical protein
MKEIDFVKIRERVQVKEKRGNGTDSDGSGGCDLNDLRNEGEGLLRIADQAIERALSGDSQRFLRANRQAGGQ